METTGFEGRRFKERIASWLAVTQELEVPAGLDEEEALERARELWRLIRDGKISPAEVELDEDFKDVLSTLVRLVWDSKEPADLVVHQADTVYRFIRRLSWPRGAFDEQRDLLLECATAGWGALGFTLEEIDRFRRDARILQFPRRDSPRILTLEEAWSIARRYLDTPLRERSEQFITGSLSEPDTFLSICSLLRDACNVSPKTVAEEAARLYQWVLESGESFGLFDEQDYFVGETALLAAGGNRHLGKREEAERWLDRADSGFRHTMNSAPSLANVAYARLALRYDQRRCEDVLELVPSLVKGFESLEMKPELVKCRFLEAMTLKLCGRRREALELFKALQTAPEAKHEPAILAQTEIEVGEQHASEGRYELAMASYQRVLLLLRKANRPMALAQLRWSIGETLRNRGKLPQALGAFQQALQDYGSLGMGTYVAMLRLVIAENLLALNRDREAEAEIIAALPTIEEQRMVPEGYAAVALLRESVRRRKTDPEALRQLREHLQRKE